MDQDPDLCASCRNQFGPAQLCDTCLAAAAGKASAWRLSIFGGVDGLTMFLGLAVGLIVARQSSAAVWHAALGGAGGELVGMASGQWLSDRASGFRVALLCGIAGGIACALPAVPFFFTSGAAAKTAAIVIAALIAAGISWARPEKGFQAVALTYGILIGAGLLSGLTGLI
jgi:hypothetical protein